LLTTDGLRSALPDHMAVVDQIHVGGQRYVYEILVAGERRVLKLMPESARAGRSERSRLGGTSTTRTSP
jgi:hypothetical protein